MYETIFEPGEELSDEELGARVRHFRTRLNLFSRVRNRNLEQQNNTLEVGFKDYPGAVYCTVSGISLVITQDVQSNGVFAGNGTYALSFTQDCKSYYDNHVGSSTDWQFNAIFYDGPNGTGATLASFNVGSYLHNCGNQAVTLQGLWAYLNAPNLIINTSSVDLQWYYLATVLPC